MDKSVIKEMVCNEISYFTVIQVNESTNLFSTQSRIHPRDMIYVIVNLEKKLNIKLTDIFKTNDSDIMTVNNLTNEIYKLVEQH